MRIFLLGLVLELLAVVYSTPVDTVTPVVPKPEDDVFREAATDGFLVDRPNLPSVTIESPKTNTTVQPSQQTESAIQGFDTNEGSAAGEVINWFKVTTTTQSDSLAHSSDSATDHNEVSPTTDSNLDIFDILSGFGSGDKDSVEGFSSLAPTTTSETTTAFTTLMAPLGRAKAPRMFNQNPEPTPESGSGSASGSGSGPEKDTVSQTLQSPILGASKDEGTDSEMHAGHSTPDWVIIVGFLVGVAALVLLCVAIATRDKWNAPKYAAQPAQPVINANVSNQQGAQEMETFLNKEMPKENGKAGEYTVIPLEELPENYSSH